MMTTIRTLDCLEDCLCFAMPMLTLTCVTEQVQSSSPAAAPSLRGRHGAHSCGAAQAWCPRGRKLYNLSRRPRRQPIPASQSKRLDARKFWILCGDRSRARPTNATGTRKGRRGRSTRWPPGRLTRRCISALEQGVAHRQGSALDNTIEVPNIYDALYHMHCTMITARFIHTYMKTPIHPSIHPYIHTYIQHTCMRACKFSNTVCGTLILYLHALM
jgi:hypothetical protein